MLQIRRRRRLTASLATLAVGLTVTAGVVSPSGAHAGTTDGAVATADTEVGELIANGDAWSRALLGFLARGGVIVLFDGGGTHAGTYQILQQAGLFFAQSRMRLTPRTVNVEAPADAVASSVPVQYQAQNQTVGFDTTEQIVVVRDRMSGLPVVVHIAR